MTKFAKLDKLSVKPGVTATMSLYMINPSPTLTLRPADETNPEYLRATLKNARDRARIAQRTGVTAGILAANRNRDRKHFSNFVITGWDDKVVDDKGKPVSFSPETCFEYVTALPDWIFDEIREFATAPSNFIDLPDEDELGN